MVERASVFCDFCGTSSDDVKLILEGRGAHICYECVIVGARSANAYFAGELEYQSWQDVSAVPAAREGA